MIKILIPLLVLASFGLASAVPQKQERSEVCQVCTLVLTVAQTYLEQNTTEEEVIGFIENQLCSKLGALSETCKSYVEAYGKVVIYELAQKINPSIVCQHIGLCSTVTQRKSIVGIDECSICKLSLTELKTLLSNADFQKRILALAENDLCPLLGQLSEQCKTLLSTFGPILLQEVAATINPDQWCQSICPHTKEVKISTCEVCQFGVNEIKALLSNADIQNKVLAFLENDVCTLLGPLTTECSALLNEYGQAFIQLFLAQLDPSVLCKSFCPSVTYQSLFNQQARNQNCLLCKLAVTEVKTTLKNAQTQQKIVTYLNQACSKLPDNLSPVCTTLVNTYAVTAINYVDNLIDPTKVCTALKQC